MFEGASSFNQPIEFDTRNVTEMDSMFRRATEFNQQMFGIGDTAVITDMFADATSFNQLIPFRWCRRMTDIGSEVMRLYGDGVYLKFVKMLIDENIEPFSRS